MRKSTWIPGLTAFTLAVASAVAAGRKNNSITFFYTTGGVTNTCVQIVLASSPGCKTGGSGCYYTIDDIQYQLYAGNILGSCTLKLQPN